jgi:hypothetical protein
VSGANPPHVAKKPTKENASERFTTESELGQLAAQWPAARLVELWNSIPGLAPGYAPGESVPGKRATRKAKAHTARDGSKKADIIRLLERAKGATLEELMETTGWQAHSVRGFISGTLGKKLKLKVESFQNRQRSPHLPREGVTHPRFTRFTLRRRPQNRRFFCFRKRLKNRPSCRASCRVRPRNCKTRQGVPNMAGRCQATPGIDGPVTSLTKYSSGQSRFFQGQRRSKIILSLTSTCKNQLPQHLISRRPAILRPKIGFFCREIPTTSQAMDRVAITRERARPFRLKKHFHSPSLSAHSIISPLFAVAANLYTESKLIQI